MKINLADYDSGSTEPWTADILAAIARGINAKHILELGTFEGRTTEWLAGATDGTVVTVEMDPARSALAEQRVRAAGHANVTFVVGDSTGFLRAYTGPRFRFAFIDDDHSYVHVAEELQLLLPHMEPGGVIAMHDVLGVFGLDRLVHRYGGVVLHTPVLYAAGGLGLISIHDPTLHTIKGEDIVIHP